MAASLLSYGGPLTERVARLARGTLLWVERLAWTAFFLFALTVLALRYVVLPGVENYRSDIEAALTRASGLKVTIGSVQAGWDGLRPDLDLREVRVHDTSGRPALTLPYVSVTLSWWSVPFGQLRLHELDIANADLDIRRDRAGKFSIGGIELRNDPNAGQTSDWILGQRRIVIRESRLRWNDELRNAPELALSNIDLIASNNGERHRLALKGTPPRRLGGVLDLRADLHGASLNDLAGWRGELYADLAGIDLAAWRAWVDYPADIRSGLGSLRTWASFQGNHLTGFTADVALNNALVRLRRDLAPLELSNLHGRIGARELLNPGLGFSFLRFGSKRVTGFEVSGKQVTLTTNDGVRLAPADFTMQTLAPSVARGVTGTVDVPAEIKLTANALNLAPIVKIVELLPLDAQLRKLLVDLDPRGVLNQFTLNWKGDFEKPVAYSLQGQFANLALNAYQRIPGFEGLSGTVNASEKGGAITLASRASAILLPAVFEDPRLVLDALDAQASWGFPNGQFEMKLDSAAFSNVDAAGTASATYKAIPGTPGYIDLTGRLTRANATAVHRYMPQKLSVNLRDWVRLGVEAGTSSDVRLKLRGNLFDFPFVDPKLGEFLVAIKLDDGQLAYADNWPRATNIKGELAFERNGMWFKSARSGVISGVHVNQLDLRIADFAVRPQILEFNGNADGSATDFLKFVAQSPVTRYLEGFTETMQASGAGKLSLKMALPLGPAQPEGATAQAPRITGQFQFLNNSITLDDGLPRMDKVNGVLAFTERTFDLRNVRGEGLGGAFTVAGGSRPGGIAINTQGNFTVPGLAAWLKDPVFASMRGGSTWRASIVVNSRGNEMTIDSPLTGLSVDLPAPLTKAAADAWPMRFVKTAAIASGEDEWNVTLGKVVTARVQRRQEGGTMKVFRAAAGVNEAMPALPRAGLAVNAAATMVDIDDWRQRAFGTRSGAAPAAASATSLPAPWQFQVRADTMTGYGRQLHQVRVNIAQETSSWVAHVSSAEANGSLAFRPATPTTQGRFAARMKNLVIPTSAAKAEDTPFDRIGEDMPAVDLVVDEFQLGERKLGKLEFLANNLAGEWRIQKVNLANPDGTLSGSGAWLRPIPGGAGVAPRRPIKLDFALDATDAGKLLDRLGFVNTLRAGSGYLKGNIGWDGSPTSIDYASLRGDLELRVEKGQFLKADPGVGKLLGIMSLQALPRRLTLDFRDVFSEGFAFDLVSASSKIERGILSTNDFKMTSVSAAVLMNGETDLARETQNLKVVVLPDLSGGMVSAVGVITGALNPLAALVSYLAQRVLKDPISKAFSFEYAVTGSWTDPKMERIQTLPAAQANSAPAPVPAGNAAPAPRTGG